MWRIKITINHSIINSDRIFTHTGKSISVSVIPPLLFLTIFARGAPPPPYCAIDRTNTQQRIDGFGFSSAWCGQLSSAKNNGPTNAVINAASGVLTWRPLVTQASTTNAFTVMVTDNGTPSMSATQSFVVIVSPLAQPQLSTMRLNGGVASEWCDRPGL